MSSKTARHIDLKAATNSAEPLKMHIDDTFFGEIENADILGGDLNVTLRVKERAGDLFHIDYHIEGKARVLCDRCLEEVEIDLVIDDSADVMYGDEDSANPDIIVLPYSQKFYDTTDDIYSLIEVYLPIQRIHPDGECNSEMLKHFNILDIDDSDNEFL